MNKKTKIIIGVCAVLVLVILVGFFATGTAKQTQSEVETETSASQISAETTSDDPWAAVDPIVIEYAHANAVSETNNIMVENWMNAVIEASGGKISFNYYPGGQLGTYVEIIEQIDTGALNMSITDLSLFESYVPEFGVMYSPFVVDSYEHAEAIAYGEAGDLIKSYVASDTNTYLLGMIMNGKRIVNTTVPIESLEDCKGVILRTPEAQVYTDTFNLLGMSPTPMSLTDTYTAMQTGMVSAIEAGTETLATANLQEVSKYYTLTGHINVTNFCSMNRDKWESLSENQQNAVVEAMKIADAFQLETAKANEQVYLDMFAESGIEIIELPAEDMAKVQEAVAGLVVETADQFGYADQVTELRSCLG